MAEAKVRVHDNVEWPEQGSQWRLCFQRVTYEYKDGSRPQNGYRFIWRRPNGKLQAARGQARIPSPRVLRGLLDMATNEGWWSDS